MTMYPPSITTTMTAYIFYRDILTANVICERAMLNGVFWNENTISVFNQTGQQVAGGVYISVPADKNTTGREYIEPDDWAQLAAGEIHDYWTVDMRNVQNMRLVKGECPFEFTWGTPQQLSQQMAQFDNPLTGFPNAKRPRDVNPQLYGTPMLHHVQIRTA
jgi:hypothetical protein